MQKCLWGENESGGKGKGKKGGVQTFLREAKTKGGTAVELELWGKNQVLGKGSFGTITKMRARRPGRPTEFVAVKRPEACQCDALEKNVLQSLDHKNIVRLKYHYMEKGLYNIVLELVDDGNLYDYLHGKGHYDSKRGGLGVLTELFTYQLFRGLAYCHANDIVHRDLKPENLLIDTHTGVLKIADFGCSCYLHEREGRACYVGTRDFRAPELIMEASRYCSKVDVWAGGVVLTELVLKRPIFYKESMQNSIDQLYCMFEYLGAPTKEDCEAMHVKQRKWRPVQRRRSYRKTFSRAPLTDLPSFLHLIERVLTYRPKDRYTAWQVCAHRFFDVLKDPETRLPPIGGAKLGRELPPLFDFSAEEVSSMPECVYGAFEKYLAVNPFFEGEGHDAVTVAQ